MKIIKIILLMFLSLYCKSMQCNASRIECDTLDCVFDTLSVDASLLFIEENRTKLDMNLVTYWGRYDLIDNIDTIAAVLGECDFSPNVNRKLLPLYIYVMKKLSGNVHNDGYIGEMFADKAYSLFKNHPGCLLQYLHFVDATNRLQLAGGVCMGMVFAEVKEVEDLLAKYKKEFPQYMSEVLYIQDIRKRIK